MSGSVAFLLVTCCLEQSRSDVLGSVLLNLQQQAPELKQALCVFDNASTVPGTTEALRTYHDNVWRCDRNLGFWTAIDWWLRVLEASPPDYVYVIESDMLHYDFPRLYDCMDYLDTRPDVGGVRLHEYSVKERQLYDKDRPVKGSFRDVWRSHTNSTTGDRVELVHDVGDLYTTSFNAHVPALNRYDAMQHAFAGLRGMPQFTERDFQRLFYQRYPTVAVLDGGIWHDRLAHNGSGALGSYTHPGTLAALGYESSRTSRIIDPSEYTVSSLV